jgi:hypothetical protein
MTPRRKRLPSEKAKRDYYVRHRERILAARKHRWDTDPVWQARQLKTKRESLLRTRYGIGPEQYDDMLAAQGGGCAICGTSKPGNGKGNRYFDVDHCHSTGKVRGLLCRNCNVTVGVVEKKDALIAMIREYLKRHQ